jgi:hypothetical protein
VTLTITLVCAVQTSHTYWPAIESVFKVHATPDELAGALEFVAQALNAGLIWTTNQQHVRSRIAANRDMFFFNS